MPTTTISTRAPVALVLSYLPEPRSPCRLQHAVEHPGEPRGTIVSSGIAAVRWLAGAGQHLAAFEPVELRAPVIASRAAERQVQTEEKEAALLEDQLPFHFLQPRGGRCRSTCAAPPGWPGTRPR